MPYSNGLIIIFLKSILTNHRLTSSNENVTVLVGGYEIENSECEKLLGVKLDWKLNFEDLTYRRKLVEN